MRPKLAKILPCSRKRRNLTRLSTTPKGGSAGGGGAATDILASVLSSKADEAVLSMTESCSSSTTVRGALGHEGPAWFLALGRPGEAGTLAWEGAQGIGISHVDFSSEMIHSTAFFFSTRVLAG